MSDRPQCSVDGCERPVHCRAMCSMHESRWRHHGNTDGLRPLIPTLDRFMQKVDKTDTCWLWTAGTNSNGYGVFYDTTAPRRQNYAHRWSYELFVGPIPDGLHIRHACDNPPCVNPAHLSVGTAADNAQDKVKRGRSKRTTCMRGHEWTAENTHTFVNAKGQTVRRCQTCRRNRERRAA